MPAPTLRQIDINKVKSTYDHLCGLLVQREKARGKNVSAAINKKKKEMTLNIQRGHTVQ